MDKKRIKRYALKSFRKHYLIFVAICLIAAFTGVEYSGSLSTLTGYDSMRLDYIDSSKAVTGLVGADTLSMNSILMRFVSDRSTRTRKAIAEKWDNVNAHFGAHFNNEEILGRSRGVLAQFVNLITSDTVSVTMLSGIQSASNSSNLLSLILTIFSIGAVMFFWVFLQNTYLVISRRIFLEGRIYSEIPLQRFLFLFRIKRWMKAVWSMLVYKMFYFLWCLTIVGAFVKRYSYAMVPFIIAENPDIKALDAITLSRKMMNGRKWDLFLLDLSLLGWSILGILTLGISDILFLNPYKIACYSEYFARVRAIAIQLRMDGAQFMDDKYLYEKASDAVIEVAYNDVISIMSKPMKEIEPLKGFRGFLANVFGVMIVPSKLELEYEKSHAEHVRIKTLAYAVKKEAYPFRLFKIPERMKRIKTETIMYLRHYSVWTLIVLFFMFCFVGWIWEVILHLLSYGEFVNRGVLHGPWLPIYGSGGILILLLLNKVRKWPVVEFFSIMTLCGTIEYFTSVYLETIYNGKKWWDYRGYFLNLNGRICAEGLLVFGITGVIFVYVVAPLVDNVIKRVKLRILIPVCIALSVLFVGDVVYSYQFPNEGNGVSVGTDHQMEIQNE